MKKITLFLLTLFLLWVFALQAAEQTPKICVAITVKNDAAVIRHCLESAKPVMDYLSVCDLGCTDNTVDEIEAFAKESGVAVCITPVIANEEASVQALALNAAKGFLLQARADLTHTYCLLLEPDAICRLEPDFTKNDLQYDVYKVRETSFLLGCIRDVPRLVRACFAGSLDDPVTSGKKLLSLQLGANEHSGYRLRKLEREAVRLTKKMRQDSDNSHVLFQLACVHYGLANYDRAVELYKQRIQQGEVQDEVWLSRYRLGEYYETKDQWEDAQYWYLEAYRNTPTRIEPLRKIATHYRWRGVNDYAYLFAKQGYAIPVTPHVLYPIPPMAGYELDEELSICAYYTPYREEGLLAINRLLLRRNIPWHVKSQTYQNLLYYIKALPSSKRLPIPIECPFIREGSADRYHPMNPSILKTAEGYDVICRTVNYTQVGSKYYESGDLDGVIRTRNFFLRLDPHFSLLSQQEILENLPREKELGVYHILGMEDCRLFSWDASLWFTCTTIDTSPHRLPQVSLCKLSTPQHGEPMLVEKLTPLLGPNPMRCEKNWLPLVKDGEFHVIYSSDPLLVYKPDVDTGICETAVFEEQKQDYSGFRGSAAPIAWNGGYLALVHEVVYQPDNTRISLHRLVWFDKKFHVRSLSLPFIFDHLGVEYCCGMTLDHSGTQLVLGVGLEDREAYFYFVDTDEIDSLLLPVD